MLSVEAPAKFVLTLQSVPPFLVESILALALVVLLAVPLIAHVQLLLDNTSKASTMVASTRRRHNRDESRDHGNRTVVMHYPAPVLLDSSSNSDLNIELTSMRMTCSTPTIKRSATNHEKDITREARKDQLEELHNRVLQEMLLQKQKTCLPLERSSSFMETKAQLPIIDISAFDYDAYRHKLIEASLKRQYGDRRAPGNVVLNSIHLNSISSQSGIQLSERYSHSLFDFIEEYYDTTKSMSKKETEYLHPLDHFLVREMARPKTADRGTETKESSTELDQVPELLDFREQSPIQTTNGATPATFGKRRIHEESKHASKLTIRSRRSSSIPRTPSQTSSTDKPSVTCTGKLVTNPTTRQLFNRADNLEIVKRPPSSIVVTTDEPEEIGRNSPPPRVSRSRTPRGAEPSTISKSHKTPHSPKVPEAVRKRASSLAQGRSSNESLTPATTKTGGEFSEAVSTDRDEEESVTCASRSSSEAGTSYSCSSRPQEKRFVRSRASSLSSRSRTIRTPSQTKQWYVGGKPNASFNRNYVETPRESPIKPAKPKLSLRPRSTGGRFAWDVPDVPGSNWCDDTAAKPEKENPTAASTPERPKTANSPLNRRRTPEKGKISDTVLPVLESVTDLRVELPCDGMDQFRVTDIADTQPNAQTTPSPKVREFKRLARSRDKKISSKSFVEPSRAFQPNTADKVNFPNVTVVVKKPSSGSKSPATRPGSVSRLPVHVASDRARMKKLLDESSRTSSPGRGKLLDKSSRLGGNSVGHTAVAKRPRTAGYVQSVVSSLSPKIERSLETLQCTEPAAAPIIAGAFDKEPAKPVRKESNQRVTTDVAHPKSSNTTSCLRTKRTNPASGTSVNKIPKPVTPGASENDKDASRKSFQQDSTAKKPFLRARSGKYGAPKLGAAEKPPKGPVAVETVADDAEEQEKELSKLPTEGSKAALVMRRELKTYIKKIKQILSNRDKSNRAKDLASLSITQTIIPELRALLTPREIQELQGLLDRVEKQGGNTSNDGTAI